MPATVRGGPSADSASSTKSVREVVIARCSPSSDIETPEIGALVVRSVVVPSRVSSTVPSLRRDPRVHVGHEQVEAGTRERERPRSGSGQEGDRIAVAAQRRNLGDDARAETLLLGDRAEAGAIRGLIELGDLSGRAVGVVGIGDAGDPPRGRAPGRRRCGATCRREARLVRFAGQEVGLRRGVRSRPGDRRAVGAEGGAERPAGGRAAGVRAGDERRRRRSRGRGRRPAPVRSWRPPRPGGRRRRRCGTRRSGRRR